MWSDARIAKESTTSYIRRFIKEGDESHGWWYVGPSLLARGAQESVIRCRL